MSVLVLSDQMRRARKAYRCGLCNLPIRPGDHHRAQSSVYDGRAYTWRDCIHCDRDGVLGWVDDWSGGLDEGVSFDSAVDWAPEALLWSKYAAERRAARAWLARCCGGEGE